VDAAVLAHGVGLLAEFEERVLSRKALPTFAQNPRRINAACGTAGAAGTTHNRASRNVGPSAVRIVAINGTRYPQGKRHGDLLHGIRQETGDARSSARRCRRRCGSPARCTVGGPARVVNHVDAGVLVTGRIRFNNIPTEQREDFVEPGVTVQVGIVEVGITAVAEPNVRRHQREPGLVAIPDAVEVLVKVG